MPGVKPSDFVFQRDAQRHILRHWSSNFTGAQLAVLLMVYDRTIGWGKLQEIIPLRHFVCGVRDKDNNIIHSGTGYSRKAIHTALKALMDYGCVIRTERGKQLSSYYEINFKWEPENLKMCSKKASRNT